MRNFTKLEKIVILIIVVFLTSILGYKIYSNIAKDDIEIEANDLFLEEELEIEEDSLQEEISTDLMIHITGQVAKPGIVTLKDGDRVIDAIEKAGGLISGADESRINLAQKLFDEDKVIIPKIGDDLVVEDQNQEGISQNSTSSNNNGTVNINTASKSELETLPGIGDVTSQKIIDYRETTKFETVEDIKDVSGIGDKKFEAIQSMITTR